MVGLFLRIMMCVLVLYHAHAHTHVLGGLLGILRSTVRAERCLKSLPPLRLTCTSTTTLPRARVDRGGSCWRDCVCKVSLVNLKCHYPLQRPTVRNSHSCNYLSVTVERPVAPSVTSCTATIYFPATFRKYVTGTFSPGIPATTSAASTSNLSELSPNIKLWGCRL